MRIVASFALLCRIMRAGMAAALLLGLGAPALAKTHALLAGVTRYDHLPEDKQLRAPASDVIRMRDALRGWGLADADMILLAEGIPGSASRASLASLRRELAGLAGPQRVQPGDWVVIYLSGHGAISRDETGTQRSGLNSVFLPADVAFAGGDTASGKLVNGLADVEIGRALDAIRARGAHVWFVNDSCHSGDTVRSLSSPDVRDKSVGPPVRAAGKAARPAPGALAQRRHETTLPGRLTAFYAAQVTETARELDTGEEGGWTSAFTLALTNAMRRQDARDARTLIAHTVQGVRAMRARGIFQTPYADEDMADGEALLAGTAGAIRNPLEGAGGMLLAGVLDGLDRDAEIAIHASAGDDTPLGRARVLRSSLTRSEIAPESGLVLPAPAWFARLVRPGPEASLTLSAPMPAERTPAPALEAAQRIMQRTRSDPQVALRESLGTGEPDIAHIVHADRHEFIPRRSLLGLAPAVSVPSSAVSEPLLARRISNALSRLDHLRRIERAEALASGLPLDRRFPVRAAYRKFAGRAGSTCQPPAPGQQAESLTAGVPLAACDVVELEITNASDGPRYVMALAIRRNGQIQTIAPRCGERRPLKLEAGQSTAGRNSAGAKSALPVVWFTLPRADSGPEGEGAMALAILSMPIDAATAAPDPCQFERFNAPGADASARGGPALFDDDTRGGPARPGDISIHSRVLRWSR